MERLEGGAIGSAKGAADTADSIRHVKELSET